MAEAWRNRVYEYDVLDVSHDSRIILAQRAARSGLTYYLRHAIVIATSEWAAKKVQTRWRHDTRG